MKHPSAFLSLLLCLSACSQSHEKDRYEQLDKVLDEKALYESYFQERASVLKDVLSEQTDNDQRYSICMRLADLYRSNCRDSAIYYLQAARSYATKGKETAEVDFMMAKIYVKSGYYLEAVDILDRYRGKELPSDILRSYYDAEHTWWWETSNDSSQEVSLDERIEKCRYYRELLLAMTEPDTWEWHNLQRAEAESRGERLSAREHAISMIQLSQPNSRAYAEAAYWYAHSFEHDNDEMFEEWMIRSAIVDVMCATKDYASLNEESKYIFYKGDIDRAFRYVANHCMPDALYYNGKLRPLQVSQFFPEIVRAYQEKHSRQARISAFFLACVSILSILLLLLLLFLSKRQRTLHAVREQLQDSYTEIDKRNRELVSINERLVNLNAQMREADKVKQEYITLFLGILSDNINTTRLYKNHVLRSIRQGNTKALVDEIEQLPSIDNDIMDFYKMFDQTFVNLYPDFVRKFNSLLVEGAEITPKGEDILTPELRIFALIKLGITDSSRIASLLHYSANTIYNYRAKTKNKARVSRDDFEEAVRNID